MTTLKEKLVERVELSKETNLKYQAAIKNHLISQGFEVQYYEKPVTIYKKLIPEAFILEYEDVKLPPVYVGDDFIYIAGDSGSFKYQTIEWCINFVNKQIESHIKKNIVIADEA